MPATSLKVSDGCVVKVLPAAVPTALVNTTCVAGPATTGTEPVMVRDEPLNVDVKVRVYVPAAPLIPRLENVAIPPTIDSSV